jgi:CDP-diacylglycerol--serine O-phosphatidyltransferase
MKFIGFYNYTVILTYLSLISGVIGMKLAREGRIGLAIFCLMLSGTCDMFDGVVARTKKNRTADEKNFGIQLDSLCDVVCFGVFPAVIFFFSGVNTVYGIAILIFYVLCAVIRLAFFNVLETKRQETEGGCAKGYRGLPVTSAAIIFPFFYLVGLWIPDAVMLVINYMLPLLTGFLFILDFHVPKLDIGKLFSKKTRDEQVASR